MKPDTEYLARQLAGLVLTDDPGRGGMEQAGRGDVTATIEMRGMTQTIRRHILLDHVRVGAKVAEEIERQTASVNIDALIAETVRAEVDRCRAYMANTVREAVKACVERHIASAVETVTKGIARSVSDRLVKAWSNEP